jgi:hypothetical protein
VAVIYNNNNNNNNNNNIFIIIIIIIIIIKGSTTLLLGFDPKQSQYDSFDVESARRKASTYTQDNTNQECTPQASMPRVGFQPMTLALELGKTVHGLDRAATVYGVKNYY